MVQLASLNQTLQSWLQDPPSAGDVRSVRRKVAANPEYEDLAEVLLNLEQKLRSGDDHPLRPLIDYFRDSSNDERRYRLTRTRHGRFSELRRLLLQALDAREPELSVEFSSEGTGIAEVKKKSLALRLESLCGWTAKEVV